MSVFRRSTILIAAVLAAALTLTACTAGTSTTVPTPTTAPPNSPGELAGSSAASASLAPVSRAVITSTPGDAATGVSVLDPVVVKAANGTLDTVAVTNPEGRQVVGALSGDGTSWTSAEPLGYGRAYIITASARDTAGLAISSSSSFTTLTPGEGAGLLSDLPVVRATTGPGHSWCWTTYLGDL